MVNSSGSAPNPDVQALAITLTLAAAVNCSGIGFQRGTHTQWHLVAKDGSSAQTCRRMRTLHKFASVHASVHNHFPTERRLQNRDHYELTRAAALAEWRDLREA